MAKDRGPTADGGLAGDVDPKVIEHAAALTPVPGGVGPVTTALLLAHTITAARRWRRGGGATTAAPSPQPSPGMPRTATRCGRQGFTATRPTGPEFHHQNGWFDIHDPGGLQILVRFSGIADGNVVLRQES